jgi:hypothetical protein
MGRNDFADQCAGRVEAEIRQGFNIFQGRLTAAVIAGVVLSSHKFLY